MAAVRELPVVCTLLEEELAARGGGISALMATADGQEETERGYRLRFSGRPEIRSELLAVIDGERDCCRFFSFALEFEPDMGPIWLRIEGPDGVKQFLERLIPA
jgi:hypothetical protein